MNCRKSQFWWGILIITVLGFTEGERMDFQTWNYSVLSTSSEKKKERHKQAFVKMYLQQIYLCWFHHLFFRTVPSGRCISIHILNLKVQCVASQQEGHWINPGPGAFLLWSLHVLPVYVRVLTRFSINMHVRQIENSKFPVGVCE